LHNQALSARVQPHQWRPCGHPDLPQSGPRAPVRLRRHGRPDQPRPALVSRNAAGNASTVYQTECAAVTVW